MEFAGLTNEVLRLLLSQNNLPITGTREQLIERLHTVDTSAPSCSSRTRSTDSHPSEPAEKRSRPTMNPSTSSASAVDVFPCVDSPETVTIPDDTLPETSSQQQSNPIQDGVRASSASNTDPSPTMLATLISTIVDEKLKNIQPTQSLPQPQVPPPQPVTARQTPQQLDLTDPNFVASLLNQLSAGNDIPPSVSQGQSSLSAHIPTKVKQAVLKGEYVEFDTLLPENSCLSDNDLPGVCISFDGKQLSVPSSSRKKKTHIDSIDKWLSAFAVYCTVLLTSFPQRAVEMFSYQEIIRSAQRKFAGFAWLSYDIDFRRKAAHKPRL